MTSGAEAWLVDERWMKAYPLEAGTTIGRSSHCTIIIREPAVSRTHARVTRDAEQFVLHPGGGSGTRVNGAEVRAPYPLQEGDVIEIAFTLLRFTRLAPTGEMFVVPQDAPTSADRTERPTAATLRFVPRQRGVPRVWRRILIVALLVLLLATVLAL